MAQRRASKVVSFAGEILNTERDTEILNRFVRINLDDNETKIPLEPIEVKIEIPCLPKEEFNPVKEEEKKEGEGEEEKKTEGEGEGEAEGGGEEEEEKKAKPAPKKKGKKLTNKQITMEMKKRARRRRRRKKLEELFTDKDRAAAVNTGGRDIKQSLRLKRKLDRTLHLQIPEDAEPDNYVALGNNQLIKGEIKVALGFYEKALELDPVEKNALVCRSKCHILLGRPDLGLKDAEAALNVDKNFIKAIYQKAEALYSLGEFEHSLVYYHRGLRIRPEAENFKIGVQKAQRAIEDSIGAIGRAIEDKNQKERAKTAKTLKKPKNVHLLKELEVDKEYLDNLLKHPDIRCKYKDDSDITSQIKEAVDYLHSREEFWKQQLSSNY